MKSITRFSRCLSVVLLVTLLPGLHAVAPSELTVEVQGEVKRPGKFVLPLGARAKDAIAAAGGFTELGDVRYTSVARLVDGKKKVFPLHPRGAPQNKGLDFPLESGDSVYVFHEVY